MSKLIPNKNWEPSDGIVLSETAYEVVKEVSRNIAVLAGPGSGKTEILAQRARFLLLTGACKSPQKILALCFKVDAAKNIKDRVRKRCDRQIANRFHSLTFDALFVSLVKRYKSLLPQWLEIPQDFDVIPFDRNWWENYERTELDGTSCDYRPTFSNSAAHSPLDLTDEPCGEVAKIWRYCAQIKLFDYTMCQSMAFTILKNNPRVKALMLATYRFVFLDEFQDTTGRQYRFLKEVFNGSNTTITAVGDTNQTIMAWAGANQNTFATFCNDFNSDAKTLLINHRSNDKIVALINYVIEHSTPEGSVPVVYENRRKITPEAGCIGSRSLQTQVEEAEFICKLITNISEKSGSGPDDFALILRQQAHHWHSSAALVFAQHGFRLRNEDEITYPGGLKIQELMSDELSQLLNLFLEKSIGRLGYDDERNLEYLATKVTGLNLNDPRQYKKVREFIKNIVTLVDTSKGVSVWVEDIIGQLGVARIRAINPQYKGGYLSCVLQSHNALLKECLMNNPADIYRAIQDFRGVNQVRLMTIHKSKGLEFDTVFFVDLNQESWWGLDQAISQNNVENLAEELNGFFVGLSRARERLYFTRSSEEFYSKRLRARVKRTWPPHIINILQDSGLVPEIPDL